MKVFKNFAYFSDLFKKKGGKKKKKKKKKKSNVHNFNQLWINCFVQNQNLNWN